MKRLVLPTIACLAPVAAAWAVLAGPHERAALVAVCAGLAAACAVTVWLVLHCRRAVLDLAAGRPAGWLGWALRPVAGALEAHRQAALEARAELDQAQLRVQVLERQKKDIEAILHSLRDAVLVVDQSDRLLLANKAAAELFGFERDRAIQQSMDGLLRSGGSELVHFVRQVRNGKNSPARMELRWPAPQGDRFFDCVACCVQDHRGNPCGAVVVLHDLTRDRQLAKAKDDFISYVSHELKTPLASITAYAEMLMDGEARDQQTRMQFLAVIQEQAARLNRLVEDILNISRVESGLTRVQKEPLSLAILVEEQVNMIRSYAAERGITILGQRPIVYDQVIADRDLISMVVVNLLSNAVKYNSPGGSVTVETEVDDARSVARVTVTDTGVGIPPEQQVHLFEKFYRAPANANRAEGTGLGLSLVKQIVERVHGGRIFFRSQVGTGSSFGFELPLAGSVSDHARSGALNLKI